MRVSRQIGWSNTSNLLYEVLRELNAIKGQFAVPTTTTTTTSPTPNLSLKISPSTNFDIPAVSGSTGLFTIEWFGKMTSDGNHPRAWSIGSWPSAAHAVSIENGNFYYWINGAIVISFSMTGNVGNWVHYCIMRYKITPTLIAISVYVDGSQANTTIFDGAIPSNGLPLYLGSEGNDSLQNGLMSSFRWTNSAVYTTTGFTPPTSPLHNNPGTILNIFQGNTLADEITDQSGNTYTITNGTGAYNIDNPFVGFEGSVGFGTV